MANILPVSLPARSQHVSHLWLLSIASGIALSLAFATWWAYENIPGIHFRMQMAWAKAYDTILPHADVLPTPAPAFALPAFVFSSPTPTPQATPIPQATPPPPVFPVALARAIPTVKFVATRPPPTATAIPDIVLLQGFQPEQQYFNNCGPTTVAINLSYWGWLGNQHDISPYLRPNKDDKNVSPDELPAYVATQGFDSVVRVNGDEETLKRFLAAGYPVFVEKGLTCQEGADRCAGWVGHYSLVVGYDDARKRFTLEDSFLGSGIKMTYAALLADWRAFNYVYVVVFPAGEERRTQVLSLLGEAADVERNYRDALARAEAEAANSKWSPAAFAWFNLGTNLTALGDYEGAAKAYDEARRAGLPYNMLWYQFGPYQAYYAAGRYEDVEHLAGFAISTAHLAGVEESYYWRGRAREALGLRDKALDDYSAALKYNSNFQLAREALAPPTETP